MTQIATIKDQEFYVGLKAFVEAEDKLLILQSNSKGIYASSLWGLPGGKINVNEIADPFDTTLMREIDEELGSDFKAKIGDPFHAWKFIRAGKLPILLLGIACEYLSGEVCLSPEYGDYAWISHDEAHHYEMLPGHAEAILKWADVKARS